MEVTDEYVKEKTTSEITKIGVQTLRNHRHMGIGIPYIKIGRSVRYSLHDVIEFMESHKIQTKN